MTGPDHTLVAGVDEAGRGPLAGPVVAAAVILDRRRPVAGLSDSKKLSARQRQHLAERIGERATAIGIAVIEPGEIDRLNILQATLRAMSQAIEALDPVPSLARVDGNMPPPSPVPVQTVIGGDATDRAISAASIIAKVHRDRIMDRLHQRHPGYGFDRNRGYPTRAHLAALERLGPCPAHRRSFRPVAQYTLF